MTVRRSECLSSNVTCVWVDGCCSFTRRHRAGRSEKIGRPARDRTRAGRRQSHARRASSARTLPQPRDLRPSVSAEKVFRFVKLMVLYGYRPGFFVSPGPVAFNVEINAFQFLLNFLFLLTSVNWLRGAKNTRRRLLAFAF